MSNLDRDFSERSIDHNHKMEEHNRPRGDFKYPMGALVVIGLLAFAVYAISSAIQG